LAPAFDSVASRLAKVLELVPGRAINKENWRSRKIHLLPTSKLFPCSDGPWPFLTLG